MAAFEEVPTAHLLKLKIADTTAGDLRAFVHRLDELGIEDHERIHQSASPLFGFTTHLFFQVPTKE